MPENKKDYIPPYLTPAQTSIINQDVPDSLVFQIDGHNYVNHSYVTSILNKAFNFAWQWTIIDQGINEVKPFKSKYNNNNSTEQQKTYYAWVLGELSYPATNPANGETIWIKKQAYGGKQIVGNAKVQSQDYKSAASDAFKKAASLVGIAKNIYMQKDVYNKMIEEESDPDNWVQWKIDLYADECNEMKRIKASMDQDAYKALVNKYCKETENYTTYGMITPSNICDFLEYVANQQNSPVKPTDAGNKPKISF